jgi:hypothetical protein
MQSILIIWCNDNGGSCTFRGLLFWFDTFGYFYKTIVLVVSTTIHEFI